MTRKLLSKGPKGSGAKVKDQTATKETMELIPIGACTSCKSLLYLGMTNCSKCGAPIGDSINLEELQQLVKEILKPEAEVEIREIVVSGPSYPAQFVLATSDNCVASMSFSSSAYYDTTNYYFGST